MAKHPLLPEPARRAVRRRPRLQRLVWRIESALVGLLWGVFGLLSPDRASRLGRALGRRLGPRLDKTPLVRENLSLGLPGRSPREIEALVREVWGEWGALLAEMPHLERIAAEAEHRIEIQAKGNVRALADPGRPAIFATAHTANSQVATIAAARLGRPLTAVFTPESNPYVDRRIARFRWGLRARLLPRDGSTRALIRALEAGGAVGVVADHRFDAGGEPVPFFGIPTPISAVPARLALRHGCELVPTRVERLEDARFRVTFYDPLEPEDPGAPPREQARQMTRSLVACFEGWFRERPEQWLCISRRWPKRTLAALRAGGREASGSTAETAEHAERKDR